MELLQRCYTIDGIAVAGRKADDYASSISCGGHSRNGILKDEALFWLSSDDLCRLEVHFGIRFAVFHLITGDGGREEMGAYGGDFDVGKRAVRVGWLRAGEYLPRRPTPGVQQHRA